MTLFVFVPRKNGVILKDEEANILRSAAR